MTTFSPLGAEALILPTIAAVGGGGTLGVPESPDGASLFASMVTGALAQMHNDGAVQQSSSVGEATSITLSALTPDAPRKVFDGDVHPAPVIDKTEPPVQGFKAWEAPVGSDLRPAPAPSHTHRWGLRWVDQESRKVADGTEPSLWANQQPQEESNEEVASGESSLRISENGGIPNWSSIPGAPLPWVPQVVTPVPESLPDSGFSDSSEPSSTPVPSGRMPSPQTGFGISPTPIPQGGSSGGNSSAPSAFLRQPAEMVRTGLEAPAALTTPVAVDATTRETLGGIARPILQGGSSGGNSSAPPAFLRQPAELVRTGLETPAALTTPVAVDATTRETLAGTARPIPQGGSSGGNSSAPSAFLRQPAELVRTELETPAALTTPVAVDATTRETLAGIARPIPQGGSSGGNSSVPSAFLRQPAEMVRTGLETPAALTTPVAVDATTRETLAGTARLQGQGREVGWQRVGQDTPRPDPIGSTDPALRGSRGEWKAKVSPIPRSVGIDASTGEPSSAVAASMALSGESPSVPRVEFISVAGEPLEEESARWGSAAAGRWLSLSSSGFTPETEAPVSEPAVDKGFPSQPDRTDVGRWAGEVPQVNLEPASGQRPAVALSPVSGPEAAAREWLPSGFTRVRQPSADSWADPRRVPDPLFRSMPAPSAQPGPEAVRPTPETAPSKVANFGEWAVPFVIADPASGSGGQSLETALSALPEGANEKFVPEVAADSKTTERTKSSPQSTNLPPSRSADIAYGGSGGLTGKVLSDEGSSYQFYPDKTSETPEKPVFQGQGTPSGKGGDPEAELPRNRSGMTHASDQTAMASNRFQMSAPETAPQRRGAGPLEAESTGAVSVARVTESSMGMPLLDPLIRESNRLPELPEAVALPQARSVARLSDQLSGEVVLLQRLRTASMTAVLRPDAGSELRVDLRRREGRVEIRATLERGDAQAIAEGWPELQQQLRAQGIHLLPLERETNLNSSKASSDPADERSAHSGGRGRSQQPPQDPAPGLGGEVGQKTRSHTAHSGPSVPSKPDHRHLLESWA
jgi:hypothetical protein